jgi:D-tyrosyl-tRNA(Tyr) deacylase
MRAVVQRVTRASVTVGGELVGRIDRGLCVLVGVARDDTETDALALAEKVVGLRIFEDESEKMNLAVTDVGGSVLAVSQFTLLGDTRRGKRPSFTEAMEPGGANQLFERFCARCRELEVPVETGRFRATMRVEISNDGPVTILLDTKKTF